MRLLDLFAGRCGWSKAFLARGWEVVAVDLLLPPEIPECVRYIQADVMDLSIWSHYGSGTIVIQGEPIEFDFICASSPCEQFSVHGMKHFHPNPKYPELGIKLFNHTRALCEASGLPYVMENVRAAQQFVGNAANHCGPFYLWGNAVPPMLPQGVKKAINMGNSKIINGLRGEDRTRYRREHTHLGRIGWHGSKERAAATAGFATIPPELASCVAAYAERLLEQRATA